MKKLSGWIPIVLSVVIVISLFMTGFSMVSAMFKSVDQRVEQNRQQAATEINSLQLEVGLIKTLLPDAVQYLNMGKSISIASKGSMTPGQIAEIARIIYNRCNLNQDIGIEPAMIIAIIEQESNFNPKAISYAGAFGLMQLTRDIFEMHLRDIGIPFSNQVALDPVINVECGTRELVRLRRYWMEQGRNDWHNTLNSYFWGVRGMWQFERAKLPATASEFFYSRAVIVKSNKWKELIGS